MNSGRGTLADVRNARRAFSATVTPRWSQLILYLCCAWLAVTTLVGHRGWSVFPSIGDGPVLAICLALLVAVTLRNIGVPVRPRYKPFSHRAALAGAALVAVLAVVMAGLTVASRMAILPSAFCGWALFGTVLLMFWGSSAIAWRVDPYGVDIPPLQSVPDRPWLVDAVIAPRRALQICAAIVPVERVGTDLLTRVLGVGYKELAGPAAELSRAQYLHVYSDAHRQWCGLTPAGRAAYRRHLRALLESGPVAVRPDS